MERQWHKHHSHFPVLGRAIIRKRFLQTRNIAGRRSHCTNATGGRSSGGDDSNCVDTPFGYNSTPLGTAPASLQRCGQSYTLLIHQQRLDAIHVNRICFMTAAGMLHCGSQIVRHEGILALYKGLAPTLLGIAPYAALNFSLYDIAKKACYSGEKPQNPVANLALGGVTGTVAATVCYPLDTVRRRMQMKGKTYNGQIDAMRSIMQKVRVHIPCWRASNEIDNVKPWWLVPPKLILISFIHDERPSKSPCHI